MRGSSESGLFGFRYVGGDVLREVVFQDLKRGEGGKRIELPISCSRVMKSPSQDASHDKSSVRV